MITLLRAKEAISSEINRIDSRVRSLEKANDGYMVRHGEANEGIMQTINNLMDRREELFSKMITM